MARTKAELQQLIRVAMGERKADLIVTGGKLVNVYSGEILERIEIAVSGGRICYVGPSAKHTCGESTEVIDASGSYVSPGFIDGHTHIGHYARPFENMQSFLPHGTTAVVASCDELSTVFGFRGLKLFLDEVEKHPLRVYTLISMTAPQDPALCSTATFSHEEIAEALADPRVLGLGEIVSWLRILQCDDEILERIMLAEQNRQLIHGHTAGARDQKLCAVAATGISSCHEPIRFEEALDRLRLGYWTMLREGSLRQDLEATLKPLLQSGVSLQRLILVTDSMSPDDVEERGHMDNVIRRAISLGMPPIEAIKASTLSPATYSGLEQEVGGIGPGRWADFVILENLQTCGVREVYVAGKIVAQEGHSLVEQAPMVLPGEMFHAIQVRSDVTPETFKICTGMGPSPKIRVMELINQTITTETVLEGNCVNGSLTADATRDLLKVAMFDRHHPKRAVAVGFLKGFGAQIGAIGLTVNLDENTLMVVGSDERDMALCANLLIDSGGGIAIVHSGTLLHKIDFPFGGLFSVDPWRKVGDGLRRIQNCLKEKGSSFDKPFFALLFLPFVTLPALRITSRGLVDVKRRQIVPLVVDSVP
jgi:adenine deaminase